MSSVAESLLAQKEFVKLTAHFASSLKSSCDIILFKTYLEFITKQNKPINMFEVYEFTFKKLKHHWDMYEFINEYIDLVQKDVKISDDDKIDKIRKTYKMFFNSPMRNFAQLWKDYETYETQLNKATAKKIISDILPQYQKTYRLYLLYKNILNYDNIYVQDLLTMDNFYGVLEIEEKNVPNYDSAIFLERFDFIFRFFAEKLNNDEVYFFWSEFLLKNNLINEAVDVCKRGIQNIKNNFFMICYSSMISGEDFFKELIVEQFKDKIDIQNNRTDLILINYLSFLYKTKGIEVFRNCFKQFIEKEIGPFVFSFVADLEYFATQKKEIPFRIYIKALQKYPENINLQKEFIKFLLKIGDLVNSRAFFEKFIKTKGLCLLMMEHEIKYGNISKFREINALECVNDEQFDDKHIYNGKEGQYKRCKSMFELYDLKYYTKNFIEIFIENINEVATECFIFKNNCVIELLTKCEIK
ncbi:Cleavage stimulation factor subunit 3 [Conglomerata obtusa]